MRASLLEWSDVAAMELMEVGQSHCYRQNTDIPVANTAVQHTHTHTHIQQPSTNTYTHTATQHKHIQMEHVEYTPRD